MYLNLLQTYMTCMGVSKNRGKTPKMDGENHGKPYEQMDDLGGPPLFWETPVYTQLYTYVQPSFSEDNNMFILGKLKKSECI